MLPRQTITFRDLPRSGTLESAARDLGHRLAQLNDRISACRIIIEGRATPPEGIGAYTVKIHLSVPGAEVHADSALPSREGHLDARTALRAAYNNAKGQLAKLKQYHARSTRAATRLPENTT
jgi:hypothetical protein